MALIDADGKLLGIDWSVWKVVGWLGNLVFFSRFFMGPPRLQTDIAHCPGAELLLNSLLAFQHHAS
jgi:hypothetical protein